jgi:hypothetical protein
MGFKACADKTATVPRQAVRKPSPEEDGKRREEEILAVKWEEDSSEEEDDLPTARITRLSDRRSQSSGPPPSISK